VPHLQKKKSLICRECRRANGGALQRSRVPLAQLAVVGRARGRRRRWATRSRVLLAGKEVADGEGGGREKATANRRRALPPRPLEKRGRRRPVVVVEQPLLLRLASERAAQRRCGETAAPVEGMRLSQASRHARRGRDGAQGGRL
jgi:hypothetical protein